MKLFIGIVLALAIVITVTCLLFSHFKQHNLKRLVQLILGIALLIILNYEAVLFLENERENLFVHSIYFVATDWILYYMLQFSIQFSGGDFDRYVNRKLMILLLAADGISLLLNTVFCHLFTLYLVSGYDGETFYAMTTTPFFYIHYFIIIMLVTFCLASLFHRAVCAPLFYRGKYLAIALVLAAIVAANVVSFKQAVDFSVIGYVIEVIVIYYCVFVFTPQRLVRKTLLLISEDMSIGMILLDVEGNFLYNNHFAGQLLDYDSHLVDKEGQALKDWCRNRYFSKEGSFSGEYTFYRDAQKFFFNIQYQILADSNNKFQGGYFLIYDRTEEINKMQKERFLATHDRLTGLYNFGYFCEKVRDYLDSCPDEELLIVCNNIKDFKMINDLFGNDMGDRVLKSCADIVKSKENKAIVYGRLSDDIFVLLARKSEFQEKQFTLQMQEIYPSGLKENLSYPFVNYVGVYEIMDRSIPISVMCDRAKLAISNIKGNYQERTAYYNDALRDNLRYDLELSSDLSEAIAQKQLKMYLQPQVLSNGKMLGAEALIRWEHPVKGMISPGHFIPLFEKNGLIADVDKYIWETACIQLRDWKQQGREDVYISVNISPKDFYLLNIYQTFTALVEKYDIKPQNLKLEITESAVIMDFDRQMELISKLRKYGFSIEMDDFGSGNSSLNMLKDIYVDILKIDMAFLHRAQDEERSRKILRMIISLSKQLGIPVVSEGVETIEQVHLLEEMGCDIYQGYYFAEPMPVERFVEKYLSDDVRNVTV